MNTILRSPDAEGMSGGSNPFAPGGGSADTSAQQAAPVSTPASEPQSTPVSQPTSQPAATPPPTPAAPPTPPIIGMSQEQLQQLIAARQQPQQQTPAEPQISDEEFRQKFNIYTASEQAFERTFGIKPSQEQLAAYNEHLQAVAKQAVTINRFLLDQRVKELQTQFQPVQQTIEQQRAQQYFNEFVGEYPGLKDYGPLLKEITDAAQARGMKFNSIGEAKSFVAAQAAKLLGKQIGDFKIAGAPAGGNNQTTQSQSGSRAMSTTSMGGRSGTSGGAAPAQSTAERLFAGTAT
jgi:hypothetical protein